MARWKRTSCGTTVCDSRRGTVPQGLCITVSVQRTTFVSCRDLIHIRLISLSLWDLSLSIYRLFFVILNITHLLIGWVGGQFDLSDPRTKLLPEAIRSKATVCLKGQIKCIPLKNPVDKWLVKAFNFYCKKIFIDVSFTSNADFIMGWLHKFKSSTNSAQMTIKERRFCCLIWRNVL